MGNFSRETFNRLKHYVSVRLQQGVPLVDADWNEKDDIRRYELQAFLKWFVGDGVPYGNDGFAIVAKPGVDNDFTIRGGNGTPEGAGRCLVEGWDVVIENDVDYSAQVLTDDNKATALGVDPVAALTPPVADGHYTAYLDIWEREVAPGEIGGDTYVYDRNLINETIGLPTCTRIKREWVVRVVEEDPDLTKLERVSGHLYYPLACIARRTGEAVIHQKDITDLRRTGVQMGSYHDTQQIVRDAFGDAYTLDGDGEPKLKVSLREAINAVLLGTVPGTAAAPLTTEETYDYAPHVVVDANDDVWVFWESALKSDDDHREIWCKRYNHDKEEWEGNKHQLRTDTDSEKNYHPHAVLDQEDNLYVFWESEPTDSANRKIWCWRYTHDEKTDGEKWNVDNRDNLTDDLDDSACHTEPYAVVDKSGDLWVFWVSGIDRSSSREIWWQRYNRKGEWEIEKQQIPSELDVYDLSLMSFDQPEDLDDEEGNSLVLIALVKNVLHIRIFDTSGIATVIPIPEEDDLVDEEMQMAIDALKKRLDPFPEVADLSMQDKQEIISNATLIAGLLAYNRHPCVVVDERDDIWIFWESQVGSNFNIHYQHYSHHDDLKEKKWKEKASVLNTKSGDNYSPSVLVDNDGNIWVFWASTYNGSPDIWCRRYIHDEKEWEEEQYSFNVNSSSDYAPQAVVDKIGNIWVFWESDRGGNVDIWYKKCWGDETQLTSDLSNEYHPRAVKDTAGDLWVFWRSVDNGNIYYRKLIPQI